MLAGEPQSVYRRGHWGVSLLVFAPVGFALGRSGRPTLAALGGGVMLWLSMVPDLDHRLPGLSHRGITHTLVFGLAVGGVGAAVGTGLETVVGTGETPLVAFGFAIGTLSVLAHLLADALTPAGVTLLWPLSARTVTLSVTRADSTVANYLLLATGVCVTAAAFVVAVQMA
jgi:inner membrane protein